MNYPTAELEVSRHTRENGYPESKWTGFPLKRLREWRPKEKII